jgi:hypothetical protein
MPHRASLLAVAACVVATPNWAANRSQTASGPATESVVIRAVIGTDGVPFNPVIVRGLTPEKDKASLAAFRQWKFRPGMKNGKPDPVVITVEINFHAGEGSTAPQVREQVGLRVPNADEDRALLEWYESRAEAGKDDSQVEAALRLSPKSAADVELVRAYAWAAIAARNGSKDGSKLRSKLAKRMTAIQIDQADRIATDWKPGTPLTIPSSR